MSRITSTVAGNAASRSTGVICGKPSGMNNRTISHLTWTVDRGLFWKTRNQFRAAKLASALRGDSRDATCVERCDLDGRFGR
ncbi:hypothetical protein, partial [Mesorhizobium sp. M8A.F.Ca.ET.167.01.1.1]|uniref:hypothetical protein n=1 Tax=Mesorhizobium sp. M8A.F.Ca.ET.167.01.1.1 TaxID=2563961 RepID=UPI001AEDD374